MDEEKKQPRDFVKLRSRAAVSASVRAIAAGYLAYLAWQIVRSAGAEDSSLPPWVSWTAGVLFAAIAALFGYFAWKQYRAEMKAAEPTAEEKAALDAAAEAADEDDEDGGV